jgi:hypothetical protein
MINCEFLEPVYFNPSIDELIPLDGRILKTTSWNYTKMVCSGSLNFSTSTLPVYLEKIENSENSFFLQKNITYGDFLIISFLIIIFFSITVGSIREFTKNRKLERL